jgi:hypothetical protein
MWLEYGNPPKRSPFGGIWRRILMKEKGRALNKKLHEKPHKRPGMRVLWKCCWKSPF